MNAAEASFLAAFSGIFSYRIGGFFEKEAVTSADFQLFSILFKNLLLKTLKHLPLNIEYLIYWHFKL